MLDFINNIDNDAFYVLHVTEVWKLGCAFFALIFSVCCRYETVGRTHVVRGRKPTTSAINYFT